MAVFNYAQGLYAASEYDLAIEQYKNSIAKGYAGSNCAAMLQLIDKEKTYITQMARQQEAQAEAIRRQEEQPEIKTVETPAKPQTKAKPIIAAPVKKRKA